ncbi:alkaline phosphatase-like protein [Apodospora peruviana]|uniref:Alkaline phosphatase n=1 Tax=Apodospora peruviana TaxID=516989 RepID=A0AAE0IC69_9PEZI|nr:alkaline phosphatase-like protein [Apodospora peruviana]
MASQYDAKATDPALLERSSEIKSYTTSRATYPGLRVFYRRHQQADQLPKTPAPIPLLVFVHGLGGSVAQFHPLLSSLTPIASCLAIDLPGCGVSEFAPRDWAAYSTDALVELLETVIEEYREAGEGQGVVLFGHSMGTCLAALLANPRLPPRTQLSKHVVGLVAICPSSGPPSEKQVNKFRKLLWIPGWIFDLWRAWDRRGGPDSASVRRFVGPDADAEAKRLQDLYNNQSRTPVWRRMAWGCLPEEYRDGVPRGGLPTQDTWAGLDIPVFLVGGEDDHVTPANEVEKIAACLRTGKPVAASDSDQVEGEPTEDPTTPNDEQSTAGSIPPLPAHPEKAVKSVILPKPATHALLYTPSTARILAGLISDFLVVHVTGRLALGWQLQYLSQEGKWDVKNLEKWQKVAPVSDPIGSVFRAIKTLREVDETHSPREFVQNWGATIKDVIDISHDNPVYDPQGLKDGGVRYHKFPTVSKVPPTDTEIKGFIDLVDKIRADQKARAAAEGWADDYVVGVHCHYGFNRTGFFIVCYLVERCGYNALDAINHFAKARPNGIKHAHFRDRLYAPAEQTPLLADDRPRSVRSDDDDDNQDHSRGTPLISSRVRETAIFIWALLATAAVVVLGVIVQHNNVSQPPPRQPTTQPLPHPPPTTNTSGGKRNLVFMVSDGMGPASLSLTRSFRQLTECLPIDDTLTLDKHFWGTSRTRSTSSLVTDSAAGATAFSCGRKSYNGAISMLPDHTPCGTVLEAAKRAGYTTGLVVTTDITDATPACFASHVDLRMQNDEIALQEVGEGVLGRVVDLMLGGGRCHFLPNTAEGSCRLDGVDVVKVAREKHGWAYADDRSGFDALSLGKNVSLPLLGLFAGGDVPFEIDRCNMADVYPSLSEMAITALTALEEATRDSEKGFFLMIEGSRIDHAGHINDPAAQVREVLEYDKTFRAVLEFLDKSDAEGVLVATSDHETGGLSTAWQARSGELPVYNWHPAVLAQANASSEYLARLLHEHIVSNPESSQEDLIDWINSALVVERLGIKDALELELNALATNPDAAITLFAHMVSMRARVGWSTHGHSAVDVNIYSSGGGGADVIRGNVENTQIGEFLRAYLNLDDEVEEITQELREGLGREKGVKKDWVDVPAVTDILESVHPLEWFREVQV